MKAVLSGKVLQQKATEKNTRDERILKDRHPGFLISFPPNPDWLCSEKR